jgi:hypothetical protein
MRVYAKLINLPFAIIVATSQAGDMPVRKLPEIKVSMPESRHAKDKPFAAKAEAEIAKLIGPSKVIPGEYVRYTYGWDVPAHLKDDSTKVLQAPILRRDVFKFVNGDAHAQAELALISTGQIVTLARPRDVNAPVNDMISLAIPKSFKGLSKIVIANRLSAPAKVDKATDGSEVWIYQNALNEVVQTYRTTTGTISGFVGDDIVSLNSSQSTPITLSRPYVLWNFALIFDKEGNVSEFQQGKIGPGEWTQVAAP